MGQDLDFDAAVGFVVPRVNGVGEEQGIGAAAPGFEAFSGHAVLHEPGDEGLGPALGGLPIEGAAPAAIGAIGVADDEDGQGLPTREEFLGDFETFGWRRSPLPWKWMPRMSVRRPGAGGGG